MIEDPKLTLDILKYFAKDEVSWPANLDDREVKAYFKNISPNKVEYHLLLCNRKWPIWKEQSSESLHTVE